MTDTPTPTPLATPGYTPGLAVEAITAELIARLRPVLGDMPEGEFLDLVRVMAQRRHRWEQRERTRGP